MKMENVTPDLIRGPGFSDAQRSLDSGMRRNDGFGGVDRMLRTGFANYDYPI